MSSVDKNKEVLRKALVKLTNGCTIQEGWPCGTCFMSALSDLGLDSKSEVYHQRNKKHDRHNEVWRAILQIKGENNHGRG